MDLLRLVLSNICEIMGLNVLFIYFLEFKVTFIVA